MNFFFNLGFWDDTTHKRRAPQIYFSLSASSHASSFSNLSPFFWSLHLLLQRFALLQDRNRFLNHFVTSHSDMTSLRNVILMFSASAFLCEDCLSFNGSFSLIVCEHATLKSCSFEHFLICFTRKSFSQVLLRRESLIHVSLPFASCIRIRDNQKVFNMCLLIPVP